MLQLYRYRFADLIGFAQILDPFNIISVIAHFSYSVLGGFLTLFVLSSIAIIEIKISLLKKLLGLFLPTSVRLILFYLLFVSPSFVLFQFFLGKDSFSSIFLLLAISTYLDSFIKGRNVLRYLYHVLNFIAFLPRSYYSVLYPLSFLPSIVTLLVSGQIAVRRFGLLLLLSFGLLVFSILFQDAILYRFSFLLSYLTSLLNNDTYSISSSVGLMESAIQYDIYQLPWSIFNIFRPFPLELGSEEPFQLLLIVEHYVALFLLFYLLLLRLRPFIFLSWLSAALFVFSLLIFPALNPNILDMYRRLPTYFLLALSMYAPFFFRARP